MRIREREGLDPQRIIEQGRVILRGQERRGIVIDTIKGLVLRQVGGMGGGGHLGDFGGRTSMALEGGIVHDSLPVGGVSRHISGRGGVQGSMAGVLRGVVGPWS